MPESEQHHLEGASSDSDATVLDPVCGMTIDRAEAAESITHGQHDYFFCSSGCASAFRSAPERYLKAPSEQTNPSEQSAPNHSTGTGQDPQRANGKSKRYTCPMHPEIIQNHPGPCPKCGMALGPTTAAVGEEEEGDGELRDMTRPFWIGATLGSPIRSEIRRMKR